MLQRFWRALCVFTDSHTRPRIAFLHTLTDLRTNIPSGTTSLKISDNLSHFPEEILSVADTLETLDLSNNLLSTLPDNFSQLKSLRTLFLSNNQFKQFPAVLAECPKLDMIGIRNNGLTSIAEDVLPITTRWLILTDNKIERLPESIGKLKRLQKVMLAGNRLTSLPASMENCDSLELIRISANAMSSLPDFLVRLPRLSWLAFAGNPVADQLLFSTNDLPMTGWEYLHTRDVIGTGASGVVYNASWINSSQCIGDPKQEIVVKRYKGSLTSDGYSHDELAASIAAGEHPNLIPLVAYIDQGTATGLLMHRISNEYAPLGKPPDRESCTRDVFDADQKLTTGSVLKMAERIASTLVHLHSKNLCHGDLYAHNILTNHQADTLLSDFGAATGYKGLNDFQQQSLQKIEVRMSNYTKLFGDDYYSFSVGNVFYIVLNSQYLFNPDVMKENAEQQMEWLKTQLNR